MKTLTILLLLLVSCNSTSQSAETLGETNYKLHKSFNYEAIKLWDKFLVTVFVNGYSMDMIVDTAANDVWIADHAANRIGLIADSVESVDRTIGDQAKNTIKTYKIDSFEFGEIRAENIRVFGQRMGRSSDGLIGINVLRAAKEVKFDFENYTIEVK